MIPKRLNPKALQMSKDQSRLLLIVVVTAFISGFCLMGVKSMLARSFYQGKVISARHKSAAQMTADIKSANTLVTQYRGVFIGDNSQNIIGGKNDSSPYATPPNGDNGRIVIDALPVSYDFPALLTSIQKMMNNDNLGSQSIGGTDQSPTADNSPTGSPKPVNIDLTISAAGTYTSTEKFVKDLERSIRPFDITNLSLSGTESSLVVNLNVTTYYQTAKTVNITSKEIK
jgi:hypothetical protein